MTRLVASLMVGPGEASRYLDIAIGSLQEFCDEIRVLCDSGPEQEWLAGRDRVVVKHAEPGAFFGHEGRARQTLWEWTLEAEPGWVLAIDCDELVSDGAALRKACESPCPIETLWLQEVWEADEGELRVRVDGGWRSHAAPLCFRVPQNRDQRWRIRDRALACGREPEAVRDLWRQDCHEWSEVSLLHFGWSNEAERAARVARYKKHDGGRFHAGSHLASIEWPRARVQTISVPWPAGLERWKPLLLDKINYV